MKRTILKFTVLGLSIAASITFIDRGSARNVHRQNPAPATAAPQEKTVEQAQKNIKVLNGMPESQLIPVMDYMAASLGRRCNFCHVNTNGQWDYAADTKPEKNTAREMIKMVVDVNKSSFKGSPTISCYTCHRGRNEPQGIPTLPLPVPSPGNPGGPRPGGQTPPAGQPQASPAPRPTPPTADELINKYVEAVGGQSAIDKLRTRIMKGNITGANGMTISYELDQSAPDKAYEMFSSQRGTMERAINGATGWERNPQGVRELGSDQLAQMKMSVALFRNLKLKEQYTRLRTARRDKINDRDVYGVVGFTPDDGRELLYFDVESGLLVRRINYTPTMVGVIPEQTDFEDYREVDGVKLPFTIRISSVDPGNPISIRKFEEIKLNAPIDDSKFRMPPPSAKTTP